MRQIMWYYCCIMKTILLILFLLFTPAILGFGAVTLYDKISYLIRRLSKKDPARLSSEDEGGKKRKTFPERLFAAFPIGVILLVLISGISNILCVFLSLDLSHGIKLFAILLIAVMTLFYFIILVSIFSRAMKKISGGSSIKDAKTSDVAGKNGAKKPRSKAFAILTVLSVLLSLFLLFLAGRGNVSTLQDQTLETVCSFISSGKFYTEDPLSGLAYTDGYPARLGLMCLPYFYAVLSKAFSVAPYVLLWNIMPVYYMITGMMIFLNLSNILFKSPDKKVLFYLICVLLLLCTNVSFGSPGFDILYTGYRASALLNLVLLPQTFVFCLKKKWAACILTIITEPLIASAFFGVGACFFVLVTVFIITKLPFYKKFREDFVTEKKKGGSQ